jgi:predicted thioredoxin/glutaredoxin
MMLCKSTLHSCVAPEDALISRDLRPILSPEDAQAIQRLVKGQKSRLKPYMKKYSVGILEDPLWKKWAEEDIHLKVLTQHIGR